MKILGFKIGEKESIQDLESKVLIQELQSKVTDLEARQGSFSGGRVIYHQLYDGEKNHGEIGPVTEYYLDYQSLRSRSWKAHLDSDIAQTVIKKFAKWVVGSGLKLQSEPNKLVLEQETFSVDKETFSHEVEARFKVWANSKMSCLKNENSLARIANQTYINAIVGGDVLIVMRVIKGNLKIQLIDGACLGSPMNFDNTRIENGIETDENGKVIAYHVIIDNGFKTERIKAYNGNFRVAFLFKGLSYRLHDNRGIPILSTVLELISKLDRYKEATVGSAEEINKIAYQIVHEAYSTGENPMNAMISKAFDVDGTGKNIPVDDKGVQLASNVAATTNKQAFNNPVGAEIKTLSAGTRELYFKDFMTVNIDLVCASLAAPPEVMMSKYDSNYSASRAALKDWEHTLNVERSFFQQEFLQYIYNFWLYIEVLKNKITLNGFLKAIQQNNEYAINAFTQCRFVGATVPHIDPLKEVEAERLKLGSSAAHIPLSTVEQAVENINGGDSVSNMEQYSDEYQKSLGLKIPEGAVIRGMETPKEEK